MSTPTRLLEAMPFAALIGIEISEARPGRVRRHFDYVPGAAPPRGVMHGGALTALADTCGAVCAFLDLPEGASGSGTIESGPTSRAQCWQEV